MLPFKIKKLVRERVSLLFLPCSDYILAQLYFFRLLVLLVIYYLCLPVLPFSSVSSTTL